MHIPVIFEDKDILVIDKPSGIVVHPYDFSTEETLLDFLYTYDKEIFSIEGNTITLQDKRTLSLGGIVHKLDRETSGVMVIAKNQKTFISLKEQFRNHSITKTYTALVEGVLEKDNFIIDALLGRNKKEYKQTVDPKNPRGTPLQAITEGMVKERFSGTTLVELTPKTGRTHQLRAHMAYLGHPIVGDIAYGSTTKDGRIMLHAASLTFSHNGNIVTFSSSSSL